MSKDSKLLNMNIEYEATFPDIDKDAVRIQCKKAGATLVKPEFLQKRVVFNLPDGSQIPGAWVRVRNEGDKITMSLKILDGNKIEDQKEVMLVVSSFEDAVLFLASLGYKQKSYQENKRELWDLNGVEIAIDEWPFLEPIVEIEGSSEEMVRTASESLGFNYKDAVFCAVGTLYKRKYNLSEYIVNNKIPRIVFGEQNPFVKKVAGD